MHDVHNNEVPCGNLNLLKQQQQQQQVVSTLTNTRASASRNFYVHSFDLE